MRPAVGKIVSRSRLSIDGTSQAVEGQVTELPELAPADMDGPLVRHLQKLAQRQAKQSLRQQSLKRVLDTLRFLPLSGEKFGLV